MTIDSRAANDSSMFDPPTIPRIPSSLLVERMRCTLGECPAHFDGVYQFCLNGYLVRAPLCSWCAPKVEAGQPVVPRDDLAALIDDGTCWCGDRRAIGPEARGLLVEFCPAHGRDDETHLWLFCRECAETHSTCDWHAQQAKEDCE